MRRLLLLITLLASTLIYGCCGCAAKEKKPMASNTTGINKQALAVAPAGSLRWDFYYND